MQQSFQPESGKKLDPIPWQHFQKAIQDWNGNFLPSLVVQSSWHFCSRRADHDDRLDRIVSPAFESQLRTLASPSLCVDDIEQIELVVLGWWQLVEFFDNSIKTCQEKSQWLRIWFVPSLGRRMQHSFAEEEMLAVLEKTNFQLENHPECDPQVAHWEKEKNVIKRSRWKDRLLKADQDRIAPRIRRSLILEISGTVIWRRSQNYFEENFFRTWTTLET